MPVSPDENPRPQGRRTTAPRTLVLFNYDWDRLGFGRWSAEFPHDHAGFDLFSFPSNARLPGFDLTRFVDRLARRAPRAGWQAVSPDISPAPTVGLSNYAERVDRGTSGGN